MTPGLTKTLFTSLLFMSFSVPFYNAHAAYAPARSASADSNRSLKKPFKISKTEFLNNYGKDDTSRALIALFFSKRSIGLKLLFVPLALDMAGGIALGIYLAGNPFVNTGVAYGWVFLFSLLIAGTIVCSSIGGIKLHRYSRKNLYLLLNNYFAGQSVPYYIKKNSFFKKQCILMKNK